MAYKRISPAPIIEGGTGLTATTAYAVVCGGTSTTNPLQSVSGVGTAGQLLTSNGAAALPTWQAAPVSGIATLNGDSGSATGSTVTLNANTNSGKTVKFTGSGATVSLSTGDALFNTTIGTSSGASLSTGSRNTCLGDHSGTLIADGLHNTTVGYYAGSAITSGQNNTAIGTSTLGVSTGSYNTAIGFNAGALYTLTDHSNICIRNTGSLGGESNTIRIGTTGPGGGQQNRCFLAGVDNVNVGSVSKVVTMSSEQLGTATITAGAGVTVTPGANTITIASNPVGSTATGFATWGGAGSYFDDTTLGSFTVSRPGTGYVNGVSVSWTAPQTVSGMTAGNTYYIYVDNTGTIGKSTAWSQTLAQNNILLFECLRDSTSPTNSQITVKENHPYDFQPAVSYYNHQVVGSVIENNANGANITLNGTQKIQINGADELADHGLYTTISDSSGVGVSFYKMFTNGSGKWATQNVSDTFSGYYNNAGTPTVLGASKFGVYTLYVSKDNLNSSTPLYFAVLDSSQYNNLSAAQTAIANGTNSKAASELAALELCQLGTIIYSQAANAIVQVNISKTTLRTTVSTAGSNTASLIGTNTANFNGILSASDTNVQAALDTIDNWGAGATNKAILIGRGVNTAIAAQELTDGQLLIGSTGNDPVAATLTQGSGISITSASGSITIAATGGTGLSWSVVTVDATFTVNTGTLANKAGLLTMTLPATAAIGDVIEISNMSGTAVGWRIAQNANQYIRLGDVVSTTGVSGYLEASAIGDSVKLVCSVAGASTGWQAVSCIGNITVV